MAHDLATDAKSGQAMMAFVGKTPWHELGQPVAEEAKWDLDGAMKSARLDNLEYELQALGIINRKPKKKKVASPVEVLKRIEEIIAAGGDPERVIDSVMAEVNPADPKPVAARAIVRKDTGEVTGDHVGVQYTLVQPQHCFDFFKPFAEAKLASFHTAGLLSAGKKIWVLARIERDPIVLGKDDEIQKFVLLSNSYDGNTSIRVGFTPVRVVCANTLALAVADKASQLIRVRHTKSAKTKLDEIRDIMDLADQEFSATAEQYKKLTCRTINQKDLLKYVKVVFGIKGDKPNGHQQAIIDGCTRLFETGRGSKLATSAGTWWGAYNCVNEYMVYERGEGADTRLTSLWFGASAKNNQDALETALQLAV
jgi:phage/plasmid-like protein (TIGR03299 family)